MNVGLNWIKQAGIAGFGELSVRLKRAAASLPGQKLVWLFVFVLLGCGLWLLVPGSEGNMAQSEPVRTELAAVQPEPTAATSHANQVPTSDVAELDRLRISSQAWRRGGLGSRALISFTLRNDNDYAVKDVEILCVFTRADGSHLTDRRRVLRETVSMKSRRTFARVHVGYVNVNASQARCALAAARRA